MGKLEMGDGAHGWGEGVGMEAPEKETMLPDWARREGLKLPLGGLRHVGYLKWLFWDIIKKYF